MARSKHHHASHVAHVAAQGGHELERHGMHEAGRALHLVGATTGAIGRHVRGWHHEVSGMMHGVLGDTYHAPRKKRRKGKRPKLTRKQIAAGFGGKRRKSAKRRGGHKGHRRLTAAQKRAGFGGKRAMKRRGKGKRHR